MELVKSDRVNSTNIGSVRPGRYVNFVNSGTMLRVARDNGFGIPYINPRIFPIREGDSFVGPSAIRAVFRAMKTFDAPIGIEIAPSEMAWAKINHYDFIKHITEVAASMDMRHWPIVVHYDHGADIPDLTRALKGGFTSAAFDGGHCKDWEDLVIQTNRWRETCYKFGVSLEAEMETIGGAIATDAQKAQTFVALTDPTMLAIAFPHNEHSATKGASEIDVELLRSIRAAVPETTFLTLHGGSGFDYPQLSLAVAGGISKINYATQVMRVMLDGTKYAEYLEHLQNLETHNRNKAGYLDAVDKLSVLFLEDSWTRMPESERIAMEDRAFAEVKRVLFACNTVGKIALYSDIMERGFTGL